MPSLVMASSNYSSQVDTLMQKDGGNLLETDTRQMKPNIPLTKAEMDEIHMQVKEAEAQDTAQLTNGVGLRSTTLGVAIGTNKTITGADAGAVYRSNYPSTISSWGTGSNGWLDCKTDFSYPGNCGSGYAWGWIGKYVSITGSGSRTCRITFNGAYNGTLQAYNGSPGANNVYCLVAAQVYDVTNGGFSLVSENTIAERGYDS